jgi:outer membrane protein insertion porin family
MKFLKILIFFSLIISTSLFSKEKIHDIKIEGLQRTDPGLVFNSIPFEINDDIDSVNFSKTISNLYKTGQFKDIAVEREGNIIIINVREKPILYELNFYGSKVFQPEALTSALSQMNITSGLIFDEVDLERAVEEIKSQYLSIGKYTASIKTEVIPITNNRVNVDFYIDEGRVTRIREINFIGNRIFSNEELTDLMESKVTNYLSWWNLDDRYSRQVLSGDLEKISSHYLDRGYLDFRIKSSTVSISKNKKNVYISIDLDEGKKYSIDKISITGNLPEKLSMEDVEKRIRVKSGDTFNRKKVNDSTKAISKYLGNFGYAYANVNAIPKIDKDNLLVSFNFNIEQGKKIYVRRVNIIGNDSSKDEVVRRELRQYESSWYAENKLDLSKARLTRTQYFESVEVETKPVPGTSDQVDVNFILKETNTGKFQIGGGVSSSDGIVGSVSLRQTNFLGTGHTVGTDLSFGDINKVWSLSLVDPYWTEDGISRGIGIYYRDYDTKDLKIGTYRTNGYGVNMNFGIPLSEYESFKLGSNLDFTEIKLGADSPQYYLNYCAELDGNNSLSCDANSLTFYASWEDNTINNPFMPTNGHKISVSFDVSTPGLDMEYYKTMITGEQFFPLSNTFTGKIRAGIGYAGEYGSEPYPFFKNFRTGGKSSIRGYSEGSVGKKTLDPNTNSFVTYGGNKLVNFGADAFFPVPLLKDSDSMRLSAFIDGGGVFEDSFNSDDMRYSAGMGLMWISPFGPLNISLAVPLNEGDNDRTEKFQFGMGSSF